MRNLAISVGLGAIAVASGLTAVSTGGRQAAATPANRTQVVLLGTGMPRPNPARSGPATAIVVNGRAYLVDAGPGVVRRAQAAFEMGIQALAPVNLTTTFLTHLHSDHTVGLPDLIFTTWVQGRKGPINLYGPAGTEAMTGHIMQAAGLTVRAHDITAVVRCSSPLVRMSMSACHHSGAAPGGTGSPDERLATEIRRSYPGKVVVGRDLDVY
jgi:hypothetical protein